MKKYLLPSAIILALGLSFGIAQNINKSVQLSQDPSGPIGFDTNNNVYFPAHVLSSGSAPALTSCGTGPAIAGSDFGGEITTGTSSTGCTATFRQAFLAAPWCTVSSQSSSYTLAYSVSTTALTIVATATPAYKINYICTGSK